MRSKSRATSLWKARASPAARSPRCRHWILATTLLSSFLCCIAPVIAADVLKCKVTVGQAEGDMWPYGGTVGAIGNYGGTHELKQYNEVCVDHANFVVTSAA